MNSSLLRTSSFLLIAFAILLSGEALAQQTRGTIFIGPGGVSARGATARVYQAGGGLERLLEHGFAASADVAAVIPGEGRVKNTVGIFAVDLNYHFAVPNKHIDPFAGGGYSLLFRDFTANMGNFGGGVNYWFEDDWGFRLEFRDNVGTPRGQLGNVKSNYWAFRIGVNFR